MCVWGGVIPWPPTSVTPRREPHLGIDTLGVVDAAAVPAVVTLIDVVAALLILASEVYADALQTHRAREARRAALAPESRRQVGAPHTRVTRPRQVTLWRKGIKGLGGAHTILSYSVGNMY